MSAMKWNILIDFDGTLHDTESVYTAKLDGLFGLDGRKLFRNFLFDIHRKIIHEHYPQKHDDLNFHWKLLLQHIGEPYESSTVKSLATQFKEAKKTIFEHPRLFPEVSAFLDRVAEAGYPLCLSTGGRNSREKAEAVTRVLGKNYFDHVLGEDLLNYLKHEPNYYRAALRKLGWNAESTVSIGDTVFTDIYPAEVVGIKTIWVNRKTEQTLVRSQRTPISEVSNLISALNLLNRWS